jgi:hypothetical protein
MVSVQTIARKRARAAGMLSLDQEGGYGMSAT